jgi:aspartyl-tRNA(Asn)/glutamyl-tRNA(Gln) amidotransferase subunit A
VTIREAGQALRSRRMSVSELVNVAIGRLDRFNSDLRAFITPTAEYARERAQQLDAELAAGRDRGALHGIPIAVKDLFQTRGVRTTCGSPLYENFVPAYSATVVERLETAGAVLLGKLNMHELAYGITSANPHFGAVRNPWDTGHSPGGSSGGSGAAVAASIVYGALGTDTGGSIRIPASFCGTVGLKPTYGRLSRYGVLPLGYTLDHMGPLARSVRDAAILLNYTAGYDKNDPSSSRYPVVDYVPDDGCSIRGLRLGFPESFFFEELDPEVESAVRGSLARAATLGAEVKPVRVPDMEAINAVSRIILLSEASAVYDAQLKNPQRFGPDALTLLRQGCLIPAVDYINSQRVRRKMRREFARIWSEIDVLITPTTPNTAPRIGENTVRLGGRTEDVRIATTRLVRGFNLLGYPALSMPCGLSSAGLPIGLQIVGPPFEEGLVMKVGGALEDGGVGIPPCPYAS